MTPHLRATAERTIALLEIGPATVGCDLLAVIADRDEREFYLRRRHSGYRCETRYERSMAIVVLSTLLAL